MEKTHIVFPYRRNGMENNREGIKKNNDRQKDIEEETYSTFPSDRDFENVVYTFSKRSHGN